MIRQSLPGAIRSVGPREIRVRMASRELGRDNMIVEPNGIDLSDFRKNPVILRDHDPQKPVARAIGFDQRPEALDALIKFAAPGITALADETYELIRDNVLNACSIGFDVVEAEPIDPRDRSAGRRITRSTLLECSIVAVPADRQALILERSYGRQAMARSLASHIEELRGHIWDAQKHHSDVERALRRDDNAGAVRSHRELGRCLDRAERCLRAVSNEGAMQDIENTSKSQNSGGLGYGTSDSGRAGLDFARRQLDLIQLAGPVVGDGGADGVQRIRDREFLQRLAHCQAVAAITDLSLPRTRVQRQDDLRRLARPFG